MFYYSAKLLGFLILPSNAVLVLGLIGLVLSFRQGLRRLGHVMAGLAILLLAAMGFSPLGNLLIEPLEDRFPPAVIAPGTTVTGIIILGGAVDTHVSTARGGTALTDSAERMTAVAGLSRRFPEARIVFSGGIGALGGAIWGDITESQAARQLFESFGIPDARMVFEDKSRDTYENARFTAALLKPEPGQRFLLVTSAYHMPRAMALFRKAGFEPLAYPVDYRTADPGDGLRPFYAASDGLRQTNIAIREWAGLLSYYLSGRIDDVFPKP